jgi:hypothetical protein
MIVEFQMAEPSPHIQPKLTDKKALQFRLSTIFVLTLVAGVLAAFLSPRGNDLMVAGAFTTVGSLLFALAVGSIWPPLIDRVFWGVVVAAMMQAVCATVILFDHDKGIYAWPLAAGVAAVMAAGGSNRFGRMMIASAMAGGIIALYMIIAGGTAIAIGANVACAAIGGALLAILVEFVGWMERTRKIPQPAIGLALVLAAIGFSLIASKVVPGW